MFKLENTRPCENHRRNQNEAKKRDGARQRQKAWMTHTQANARAVPHAAQQTAAGTHLRLLHLLHDFALLDEECADNAATDSAAGQNTTVGAGDGLLVLGQSLELVGGERGDAVQLGAGVAAGVVTGLLLHMLHREAAAGCAHQAVLV